MDAITYSAARQCLAATMDKVIEDHEPVIITRQKAGAVVMMSLEDFNGFRETEYLLGSPTNAKHLLKGITDIETGKGVEVRLEDL